MEVIPDSVPHLGVSLLKKNLSIMVFLRKKRLLDLRMAAVSNAMNQVIWDEIVPQEFQLNSGNKPPGVPSFNMEIIEEPVSSDSNSAEVLDSLPLGHIAFENNDEMDSSSSPNPWPTSRPSWMNLNKLKPRNKIGDALAMVAEYILNDIQPFPGDNHFLQFQDNDWEVDNRFSVTQRRGDTKNYMVHDFLTNFRVKVSKKSLADESFDLGQWYTRKRL